MRNPNWTTIIQSQRLEANSCQPLRRSCSTLGAGPGVVDAVVGGVPHERFGHAVVAVVQLAPDSSITAPDLIARAGRQLADYKVPRRIVLVDDVGRGPTGKVDLNAVRGRAQRELGVDTFR